MVLSPLVNLDDVDELSHDEQIQLYKKLADILETEDDDEESDEEDDEKFEQKAKKRKVSRLVVELSPSQATWAKILDLGLVGSFDDLLALKPAGLLADLPECQQQFCSCKKILEQDSCFSVEHKINAKQVCINNSDSVGVEL